MRININYLEVMMKKFFAIALFLICGVALNAQNLQLHYDFGKNRSTDEKRDYFTATFEMFKPDEYGSTFYFIDFDFNQSGNKSASLAYFEIARYVTLPILDKKLDVTLQYNDGIIGNSGFGMSLGSVWLSGFSYPIDLGCMTVKTDLLARKAKNSDGMDAQVTLAWFKPFYDGKLSFTGFMDIWSEKTVYDKDRKFVLLTEPQLWYNVWNHLSVGTEIEISNNFVPLSNKVEINPTLAIKWNF